MPLVSSIKVGIRARPLGYNELRYGCQSCVRFQGENDIIIGEAKQFSFDHVFSDQTTQEEIYKLAVCEMINNLFLGYNVTVLAYGQTGSGKTFTMGTNFSDRTITPNSGVIPRAIQDIYAYLDPLKENADVRVKVSFIEVYNEEIFDLLSNNKEVRSIREENQDVKIPNLVEQQVNCSDDIFKCLLKGSENRAVGSTAMNETSSRSHAIFTIYISVLPLEDAKENNTFEPISSKLHLVDLAGSERAAKTLATGDRFKEGVNINRGLLALGNVISSLVERDKNKNKNQHIPYRESKLTRLLQDSLGGNTKTLMLACISPADSNFEETRTTLNYAARARQIENKPIINKVDSAQGEIYQLRAKVAALEAQLRNVNGEGTETPPTSQLSPTVTSSYFTKICELNAEVVSMQRQKFELIEEFDEELSKKDDLLKRLWDKMNSLEFEKDETYYELEKLMSDILTKEVEVVDNDEQSVDITISEETKPESKEKKNFLKCLREELKSQQEHLDKIESENIDLVILQQYEEKNRELLQRIKELEDEKLKATPKHREDDVEIRLKDARQQLVQLNSLKKEKEKNANEVKQLKIKIDELKKSICKVSKELQTEKAQFRKIAADKERQYKCLENKDRILKTQMEKQAMQHAKETAVLRRRVATCTAEGKRLKDILDSKRHFGMNRISRSTNKNISGQVKLWIRQSLEQATERCETRQRFNLLIEERRKLTEQLGHFTCENDERFQLESEIKRLNDCISQLQQVELNESVNDIQIQACWSQLRNINEYKIAIRFMFRQLVQERVNHVIAESELKQVRVLNTSLEQVNATLHSELEQTRTDNELQLRRSLAARRSTMIFSSLNDKRISETSTNVEGGTEPPFKRQRTLEQRMDNESCSSSVSRKSRQSSRVSRTCRCQNGCRENRCGCRRSNESCNEKCRCKGLCMDERASMLDDIVENNSDNENEQGHRANSDPLGSIQFNINEDHPDEPQILNRTFISDDDTALNKSFICLEKDPYYKSNLILPNIDDEDKENINNRTLTNRNALSDIDKTLTESLIRQKKSSRPLF